jgi:hypothetical protein
MIGQLLGAVGSLASTYLDGKVAVQKANAELPRIAGKMSGLLYFLVSH